jgi:hypothetical protein
VADHDFMTSVLDWFWEIEEWIPGIHSMVGEIIFGQIPRADANNAYDLADAWGVLAQQLTDAYEEAAQAADGILQAWQGDGAAASFADQWYQYLDALGATAESAGAMQHGVQAFGLQVELMKFMAALNLVLLAISIYMIIAAAIPTGGASLGAVAPAVGEAQLAIRTAASRTVGAIADIVMRAVLKSLTTVFGRALPALVRAAVPAVVREAVPRLAAAAFTRLVPAAVRTAVADLARQMAARGITRSVANRLAAQALRGASGRALREALARAAAERGVPALAGQGIRAVEGALAREIEVQLLGRFTNRAAVEVVEQGSAAVLREFAEAQVARVTLGRELAGYIGIRVAFGAGFMGGGNLLGQLMQVRAGHRTDMEWGQVWQGAAEGAAFAAGMWGGPAGHMVGGAVSGAAVSGAHEAYEHFVDGTPFSWADVGHGAFQGAVAGALFGTQNHLETVRLGGGLRIGEDVHVLRNESGGLNILVGDAAGRRIAITDTGQFAYERPVEGGTERGWSENFTRDSGIRIDIPDGPSATTHDTSLARLDDRSHVPVAQLPAADAPVRGLGDGGALDRGGVRNASVPDYGPSEVAGPGHPPDGWTGGPDDTRLAGAGAEPGVDPTAESIAQGTVRMEDHPAFPNLRTELRELGYDLVPTTGNPHVEIRHIVDDGGRLLLVEREVRVQEGMRFLDLEHERGHVLQMTDRARFPDGPPPTEVWRRQPDGSLREVVDAPDRMTAWQDRIVEYHVRLEEFIRLTERGVDPVVLAQHASGLDDARAEYWDRGVKRDLSPTRSGWAREHFPDIPALEERAAQLRAGEDLDTSWGREHSDGDPARLQKGPGGHQGGGVRLRPLDEAGPEPGHPEGLAGGPTLRGLADRRIPYELVPVDELPAGPLTELPDAVATAVDRHVTELLHGRPAGAPGQPHRGTWHPSDRTVTVHYPDGLSVRVALQVNSVLPAGHPTVLRPALELVEGAWRQSGLAGIVLPAHAPADPVARTTFVDAELAGAWQTLHQELHAAIRRPVEELPLSMLEDGPADAPVLRADEVSFRDAAPTEPTPPRPWTPEAVGRALAEPSTPPRIAGWLREHLAIRTEDGSFQPRSAEEISATLTRLQDEGARAVTRIVEMPDHSAAREPRSGEPESRSIAAAVIPDSQFHEYGRTVPEPEVVAAAARAALEAERGRLAPDAPLRRHAMDVVAADADGMAGAVARSVPVEGGGYRVEVSDRAADRVIERAVAHEVAEIAAILDRTANGLEVSPADVLQPGEHAPGSSLSPHDLGRLAEVRVLAQMLENPALSGLARLELAALRDHLGLAPDEPGAAARLQLVDDHLGPGSGELLQLSALGADLVGVAERAGIPRTDLDVALVRPPGGGHVVRIYSDEAFLNAARQWDPARHAALGPRPFTVDGPMPEALTHDAVPGLRELAHSSADPQNVRFETRPAQDARAAGPDQIWLYRREPAPAVEPAASYPEAGRGGVHLALDEHGHVMPVDRTGYQLRERDLAFIGADQPVAAIDHAAIDHAARGEVPLGMPPERWSEWRSSLREALIADGIDPSTVDVRLKGSAAEFFSGMHKAMPTEESLAADRRAGRIDQRTHDTAVARLREWFGDDDERPTARIFDTMYRLGLDNERSDFDLNFSSDEMFRKALARWDENAFGDVERDGSRAAPIKPADRNHGYLTNKDLVWHAFPRLREWADHWERELGRPMSYAIFLSRGPDVTTDRPGHGGISVHYRDSDWVIQRAEES